MSDYQRITSYLYEYRNGSRGENVGFIRVETRDQQLKISFTLNISTTLPKLHLYFYYYSHGKMIGVSWDEIADVKRHYEYKESFYIHSIFNHAPLLTDMDGVLFYDNNSHFYGSQWNENPIDLHVFEAPSKRIQDPKISKNPSLDEYMEALALHESIVEEPTANTQPQGIHPKMANKQTQNISSTLENKQARPISPATSDSTATIHLENGFQGDKNLQESPARNKTQTATKSQTSLDAAAVTLETAPLPKTFMDASPKADLNSQTSNATAMEFSEFSKSERETSDSEFAKTPDSKPSLAATEIAKELFASENAGATSTQLSKEKKTEPEGQRKQQPSYPQIYPYPTPDYSSCIKLTLDQMKDFACIPKELSGNGFLKMQVQNYGHLFLGEQKLTDCHYIGIPGIFTNQRNFVAHLFGFPDFITVPHEEQKTGNFGYWVMTIR